MPVHGISKCISKCLHMISKINKWEFLLLAFSPEIDSISFADFSHCIRYILLYH